MPRIQVLDEILSIFKPQNSERPRNDSEQPHDGLASASVLQNSSGTGDLSPDDIASESTSNGIPVNILAFRTITTILGQLPRTIPIEPIDNLEDHITIAEDRQEIKIYDAFAHLAAAENDVTALTTTNRSTPNGTKLSIMTCTQANSDIQVGEGDTLPLPSMPEKVKAKLNVWSLMVTRNFRRDDVETSSGTPHPIIISSSEPVDLGGRKAYDYMVGLEQHW